VKDSDKTKIYSDDNRTTTYGSAEKRTKETVHELKLGDQINLNSTEYQIVEIISESTGEAVIYKVEDEEKNIFGLKLYFEFYHAEQEPNTEALERIKTIEDNDILKLFDFGTGKNKYKTKYCFEILEFAHGGDLLKVENIREKYSSDFIITEVIPQIYKGILSLHDNKIYHCDLKPQNVFYLDKEQVEIVIGDYGSAKTFDFDAAKSSRKTTTVKGTDFYLPPEQARGFISEKNDYYSFGMILLHLVYPDEVLINENEPKNLSYSKLKGIIERQFEALPIIDYNPNYKRINKLIEGLTLVDFNLRWGTEEVQLWIDNKDVEVVYQKAHQPGEIKLKASTYTLKFGKYSISTPYDLRDYLFNDNNWYEDLIEDTENREDFINWMLNFYDGDRSKRSAFNRIIKNYSPEGLEFVSDAVIRFFIPEHPVLFGFKSFDFAGSDDLKKTTAEAFSHLIFDLWNNSSDKDIQLYIFRYEFALRNTKNREETNRALKILYENLSKNENAENDFEDYMVSAYTSISKNLLNNIKQFLCEYLPSEIKIDFIKLTEQGGINYKIVKTLNDYYVGIGINKELIAESNENISVNYTADNDSLEDYCDEITETICDKHKINKEKLFKSDLKLFKSSFVNANNELLENLKNEYGKLRNDLPGKIKRLDLVKANFKKIDTIIKDKTFHQINDAYGLISKTAKYAKKQLKSKKKKTEEIRPSRPYSRTINFRGRSRSNKFWLIFTLIVTIGPILLFAGNKIIQYISSEIDSENNTRNKPVLVDYSVLYAAHSETELIFVEGGTFKMGTNNGYSNAKPKHEVTVDSFYLGRYEITNDQYCKFLNKYGSDYVKEGKYKGKEMINHDRRNDVAMREIIKKGKKWKARDGYRKYPVVEVSWYGAYEYCRYYGGSLPSEAQWEFAAKGGIYHQFYKYPGNDTIDNVAWTNRNDEYNSNRPGGMLLPNEIGLYDMMGNVAEWNKDTYSESYYANSPKLNPFNDSLGENKVLRGGSTSSYPDRIQIEDRDYKIAEYIDDDVGFRFCFTGKPDGVEKKEKSNNPSLQSTFKNLEHKMIYVEGGTFFMGHQKYFRTSEKHPVTLSSFYISN